MEALTRLGATIVGDKCANSLIGNLNLGDKECLQLAFSKVRATRFKAGKIHL